MNMQAPEALKKAIASDVVRQGGRDCRSGSVICRSKIHAENAVAQYAEAVCTNRNAQVMFLLKVARDIAAPHDDTRDMLDALLDLDAHADEGEGDAMDERGDRFMEAARKIAEHYGANTMHWG